MGYCYSKQFRLREQSDFQRLYRHSQRVKSGAFALLARPNGLDYPRLGVSLAKKYVRHAVVRNRIKRQARESFRLRQLQLSGMDFVLVCSTKNAKMDRFEKDELQKCLNDLWTKAGGLFKK